MTTALQIIEDAFGEIDVFEDEAPIEPVDAQRGLRYLNRMMARLPVDVGWTNAAALSSTLTPDLDVEDYMVKNLAKTLCGPYERPVSQSLSASCKATRASLLRNYVKVSAMEYPCSFPNGSGDRYVRITDYDDVTYVNADYTLLTTDSAIDVDCSNGPVTITLMAASGVDGYGFEFRKIDTTSNAVILLPVGSDTINGNTGDYRFYRYEQQETLRGQDGDWRI